MKLLDILKEIEQQKTECEHILKEYCNYIQKDNYGLAVRTQTDTLKTMGELSALNDVLQNNTLDRIAFLITAAEKNVSALLNACNYIELPYHHERLKTLQKYLKWLKSIDE